MAKRKGLGKGLDVLLSRSPKVNTKEIKTEENKNEEIETGEAKVSLHNDALSTGETLKLLPVEILQRGQYQPRKDMDPAALEELKASIQEQGIIQPIVVREIDSNRFEIVAGERRWRASQMAGLTKVPCVIKQLTDEATLAIALIENLQRENLNPIEEAVAIKRLQDEFELTHKRIAEIIGRSRTSVTNSLRLLTLEEPVRILLENGDIEMGHARSLLALKQAKQIKAANIVCSNNLSVRQTEALVKKTQENKDTSKEEPSLNPDVARFQNEISERLGVKVSLKYNNKGNGTITIAYNTFDELEGIVNHIS